MNLLTFEEIQEGLDKIFIPLEPMLDGYRLKKADKVVDILSKCEPILSVIFPSDFQRIISTYNFGNLTIGPIAFCATGDYSIELIEYNESIAWWGDGQRPANLTMVANSDPFAIILNVNSGEVLAMDPELGWEKSHRISANFENFVRGIGSIIILRNDVDDKEELAKSVHDLVGSHDLGFWLTLAK